MKKIILFASLGQIMFGMAPIQPNPLLVSPAVTGFQGAVAPNPIPATSVARPSNADISYYLGFGLIDQINEIKQDINMQNGKKSSIDAVIGHICDGVKEGLENPKPNTDVKTNANAAKLDASAAKTYIKGLCVGITLYRDTTLKDIFSINDFKDGLTAAAYKNTSRLSAATVKLIEEMQPS